MNSGLVGATHAGRYANASVLLILGLFVIFMSYALAQRASLPVELHDDDAQFSDPLADDSPDLEWVEGERRRSRLAVALRPSLLLLGTALVVAAGVAALVTWL